MSENQVNETRAIDHFMNFLSDDSELKDEFFKEVGKMLPEELKEGVEEQVLEMGERLNAINFISLSIIWPATDRGQKYWLNANHNWKQYIKANVLNG